MALMDEATSRNCVNTVCDWLRTTPDLTQEERVELAKELCNQIWEAGKEAGDD